MNALSQSWVLMPTAGERAWKLVQVTPGRHMVVKRHKSRQACLDHLKWLAQTGSPGAREAYKAYAAEPEPAPAPALTEREQQALSFELSWRLAALRSSFHYDEPLEPEPAACTRSGLDYCDGPCKRCDERAAARAEDRMDAMRDKEVPPCR